MMLSLAKMHVLMQKRSFSSQEEDYVDKVKG